MACVRRRRSRGGDRGGSRGRTDTMTGRPGTAATKERLNIKCVDKNWRRKLNEEAALCSVRRLRDRNDKSIEKKMAFLKKANGKVTDDYHILYFWPPP